MNTIRTTASALFVDPFRQGRLRLDELPPAVRQLAVAGLVALGALFGSLLFNDFWRRGSLTLVRDFEQRPRLVPTGIVAFTVVSLWLAWVLLFRGAAAGRRPVALLVAVAFLVVNGTISDPALVPLTNDALLRAARAAVRVTFWAAPTLLVAMSFVPRAGRWRVLRLGLAVVAGAALALFFAGGLCLYVRGEAISVAPPFPQELNGALNSVEGYLVPLFMFAVAALVQLSQQVAGAVATPFWNIRARTAKALLVLVLAFKLRVVLVVHGREWVTYVREQPFHAAQAVGYLALVALAAWLIVRARRRIAGGEGLSIEGVLYAGALLLASTTIITTVAADVAAFVTEQGNFRAGQWMLRNFPFSWFSTYGLLAVFSVVLVAGLVMFAREWRVPWVRELGAVLVVLGVWAVPNQLAQHVLDLAIGFRTGFVDLLVTVILAAYVVVRWRRLDTAAAVRVGALVAFVSLAAGNNYLLTRVLALFTPPGILLFVIGIIYVLLADSGFTSASSETFPRAARVLLWIGYLILTVTITNFALAARESELRIEFDRVTFYYLALPFAAWLGVRLARQPPPSQPVEAMSPAVSTGPE